MTFPRIFALVARFGCLLALVIPLSARDFNVLNFGAKGDGVTLDTAAIQSAIDAAAAAHGRAVIPRWRTFLTGTLELKPNMDFHLNGTLLISTNQADYFNDAVITASNAANLKITGGGKILGRSLEFMTGYDAADEWWLFKEWRPTMFKLVGCTNLVVRGITFGDAPFWGLHMLGCENVLVEDVTVKNRLDVPNCDGIDPDHCRNVEIRDCNLTCGDDAIVLKSTRQTNDFGDCSFIRVHDCKIFTQDAGLKIGTETTGKICDVVFERCKIISSSRGLAIQLRDEGDVTNITFRDITIVSRYHSDPWWGRGEAISFTSHQRNPGGRLGKLSGVKVENVSGRAENSIRIHGSDASRIEDVAFKNVSFDFARWTKYKGGVYDNRPTKVLAPIEPHAMDAFSIRHADNVRFLNCRVSWSTNCPDYFSHALLAEDVTDFKNDGFKGGSAAHPVLTK